MSPVQIQIPGGKSQHYGSKQSERWVRTRKTLACPSGLLNQWAPSSKSPCLTTETNLWPPLLLHIHITYTRLCAHTLSLLSLTISLCLSPSNKGVKHSVIFFKFFFKIYFIISICRCFACVHAWCSETWHACVCVCILINHVCVCGGVFSFINHAWVCVCGYSHLICML